MRYLVVMLVLVAGQAWAAPRFEVVRQALTQGGFMVAQVAPDAVVRVNDVRIPVGKNGLLVVGFDRFAKPKQVVNVCEGAGCASHTFKLTKRVYKVQNVKGVPPKTVDPNPAEQALMAEDNAAIGAARKVWRSGDEFAGAFSLPLQAETSGVYGSRRTYNGHERSWHKGHDLAATTGTPVVAPAGGVVRLARNTFMSGNLVIVDHGHYITSLYAHLDSMAVKVGDVVKAGDKLGEVGTTGRSTGPHLHWGINWKNIAIDPILWVGHTSQQGE